MCLFSVCHFVLLHGVTPRNELPLSKASYSLCFPSHFCLNEWFYGNNVGKSAALAIQLSEVSAYQQIDPNWRLKIAMPYYIAVYGIE